MMYRQYWTQPEATFSGHTSNGRRYRVDPMKRVSAALYCIDRGPVLKLKVQGQV